MRNRMITSLLTLGGVLLAALPMLRKRARPSGWQRLAQWFTQMMSTMTGRGSTLRRMVRRRVRA